MSKEEEKNKNRSVERRRDRNSRDRKYPSRVLLDLPTGVFGNVELNLSWPPTNSSIDSEEEDDDEEDDVENRDDVALSRITETEEDEDEEEDMGETMEDMVAVDERKEDDVSSSSSLEVSRSMNSDDSGLLFERYL